MGRLIIGKRVAVATWVWVGLVCGSTVLIYLFGLGFFWVFWVLWVLSFRFWVAH